MKFLDLFAGIGGFRLGLERAGHECVGFVEIDKFARASYEAMHDTTGEWTRTDITKVTDDEWKELYETVDILTGGFPCQSFSIAGKRRGFSDTRGTMFFEIARAAKQIKPQILLLENVKGLLSHAEGQTFGRILETLDELGYDAEWQVLNSKDFGVPQNRERVFIVGHLRGGSSGGIFPLAGTSGKDFGDEYAATLKTKYREAGGETYIEGGTPKVRQVGNLKDVKGFGGNPQVGRVYSFYGLSPTLNTMGGGGREPKVILPVLTPDRAEKRQNGRRMKEDGEPMFTLTAQDRHGVMINEPTRIRRLTPKECWRLQGFPDELFDKAEKVNSKTQLYKQAGNSVTVNVIEAIGRKLRG